MLRKKQNWTSLLITIGISLVIGFTAVLPAGALTFLPNGDRYFKVTVNRDDSLADVSAEEGYQMEFYRTGNPGETPQYITVVILMEFEAEVLYTTTTGASELQLGYDDLIFDVYRPDGTHRWRLDLDEHNSTPSFPDGVSMTSYFFNASDRSVSSAGLGSTFGILFADIGSRDIEHGDRIVFQMPEQTGRDGFQHAAQADVDRVAADMDNYSLSGNEAVRFEFTIVDPDLGSPDVLGIRRVYPGPDVGIDSPVVVEVMLSEQPFAFDLAQHINVTNGAATAMLVQDPITTGYYDLNENGVEDTGEAVADLSTGRAPGLHRYFIGITPYLRTNADITISVNRFKDLVLPPKWYESPPEDRVTYRVEIPRHGTDGREYLPDAEGFFGVELLMPDVSAEEGYQVDFGTIAPDGYPSSANVWLPFRFDTDVVYAQPEYDTAAGRWNVSGDRFGKDDITVKIVSPEGVLRWEYPGVFNDDGALPDVNVGVSILDARTQDLTADTSLDTFTLRLEDNNYDPLNFREYHQIRPWDTLYIQFKKGTIENADSIARTQVGVDPDGQLGLGKNDNVSFELHLVLEDKGPPNVLDILRAPTLENLETRTPPASPYISEPFSVAVLITERPKTLTPDHIAVTNGSATAIRDGIPTLDAVDANLDGVVDPATENVWLIATGREPAIYTLFVDITPDLITADPIVVSIKPFEDLALPPNTYNGTFQASFAVDPDAVTDPFKAADAYIAANPNLTRLPEKLVIPANGYLVLASGTNNAGTNPSGIQDSPLKPAEKKTEAEERYNILYEHSLNIPTNDLETFFRNGGTLQLLHLNIPQNRTGADSDTGYPGSTNRTYSPGDIIISEVMWGLDRGMTDSQYIELHNTTDSDIGIDKYEWVISISSSPDRLYRTVVDVMGNNESYWELPGSSGSTLVTNQATPGVAYPITNLVSMSRVGTDGTVPESWTDSVRPSVNLSGHRIGTPGAPNNPPIPEQVGPAETPTASIGALIISEIMVNTLADQLPQWIEIANISDSAVSLAGWSVSIVNDPTSTIGASQIPLPAIEVPAGQVMLLVSGDGRQGMQSVNAERVVNLNKPLLSQTGFMISLLSPTGMSDMVGNLSKGWPLPTQAGRRRSLVRVDQATAGTDAQNWSLARVLERSYVHTYYGIAHDAGTPGWYGAGGALPVELSLFVARRDAATGAVEIRWETQSERNNAGFHIKRSESRNGTFRVITPAMIPGAGTTSEKHVYTYTDVTAKPNRVYYYQIEDVSLEGERQVLTPPHRLKGHISAGGKATLIWGELKSQE